MDNIISIKEVRKRFNDSICNHRNILVDERLMTLECADCGEELNPIHYIASLARRECTAKYNVTALVERIEKLDKKLKDKNRCKCEHCGKLTKIVKDM